MKELEKQIAELKEKKQCWTKGVTSCRKDCKEFAMDDLDLALKIIKALQAEIKFLIHSAKGERYIISELHKENQQLREKLEVAKNALEIISTQEYYYSLSLSKEVSEESIVKAMSKYAREKLNQLNTKETKGESNDR